MFGLKSVLRYPFRALKRRIVYLGNEMSANIDVSIKNTIACNILRDLDVAHKDKLLVALYPKFGRNIAHTQNLANVKRYLELVRPVQVSNLMRVGGANDGGYVMINPQIDLLNSQNLAKISEESTLDSAKLPQIPPPSLAITYKTNQLRKFQTLRNFTWCIAIFAVGFGYGKLWLSSLAI